MEILIDACALMAVIVKEPERDLVIQLTQDAVMVSPDMVSYEIANALTKWEEKMLVFDIADFSQNVAKVFDAASTDEVIINNKDGKSYKILPVKTGKSPLEDIPYITADITTQEIVELIREGRAGI